MTGAEVLKLDLIGALLRRYEQCDPHPQPEVWLRAVADFEPDTVASAGRSRRAVPRGFT